MFHTLQDGADYPYETLKYYCDLWEEQEIRKQKRIKFLKIFLLCAAVIGVIALIVYQWGNIMSTIIQNQETVASYTVLGTMCLIVFFAGYIAGKAQKKLKQKITFLLCTVIGGIIGLIAYHWDCIVGNTEVIASLILLAVMCFLVFYAGYTRGMEKRKK